MLCNGSFIGKSEETIWLIIIFHEFSRKSKHNQSQILSKDDLFFSVSTVNRFIFPCSVKLFLDWNFPFSHKSSRSLFLIESFSPYISSSDSTYRSGIITLDFGISQVYFSFLDFWEKQMNQKILLHSKFRYISCYPNLSCLFSYLAYLYHM
jgi:hypothetical protein